MNGSHRGEKDPHVRCIHLICGNSGHQQGHWVEGLEGAADAPDAVQAALFVADVVGVVTHDREGHA